MLCFQSQHLQKDRKNLNFFNDINIQNCKLHTQTRRNMIEKYIQKLTIGASFALTSKMVCQRETFH